MESWCFVKHKSSLLTFMMLLIFMFGWTQGISIEDERKALLEIKASLHKVSNFFNAGNLLPTWVDQGSKYCDWERIKCDTISGYVTDLSLGNMFSIDTEDILLYETYDYNPARMIIWPLNASLFLHFKELRRLDLSLNYIGNTFVSTGLERLSELKKLENMNLSNNFIETNIFPSLSELTSLKILDLSYINGYQGYSSTHDISEFRVPENMEVLYVTHNGYYGTLQIQGSHGTSMLSKMKILNLTSNQFNKSLVTSLGALTSLESLDLSFNRLYGLFPSQEISHLTNLEKLDLSVNSLNVTPSVQDCMSLMRLERLERVSLEGNYFNKSIISCLSFLPSLKILDLSGSYSLGSSFPMQELSSLRELKRLDMRECDLLSLPLNGTMNNLHHLNLDYNDFSLVDDIMSSMAAFPSLRFLSLENSFSYSDGRRLFANEVPNLPYLEVLKLGVNLFNGTLPMEALASFHSLKMLDLSYNNFVGSIPSTIKSLSSLQAVSFAHNALNGSLTNDGFCDLKNLLELDLSHNMFDGNLPNCFSWLSSLKLFDISSNQFTGIIPPSLIVDLTSLEYVDFSLNVFEGSFSFSLFSNHTKLQFFRFERGSEKIQVETEEPIGWIPMFQLKSLELSNCIIKGSVVPSFLLHQHDLRVLDLSHNSFEGQLPNWLLKNKTKLKYLDMSGNHITGTIPQSIQNSIPYVEYLNFSSNALNGVIPTSMSDLSFLQMLDLSNNKLSGEVPKGLFTNLSNLFVIKLSKNTLHGHVLSGNLSWLGPNLEDIRLEDNCFTGNIGNYTSEYMGLYVLDISDNQFTGGIPSWISNMCPSDFYNCELVARNNHLEGQFPCGKSFSFLDISQNSFSGPIPSCINLQNTRHLHLGSNRFTGSVPDAFRNLTNVLTLDISQNYLSGKIPEFLAELSNLRILLLGKNKFIGSIPEKLCQLNNVSLIDISSNSLTGSIPRCLNNITGPKHLAFMQKSFRYFDFTSFEYDSVLRN